jgi:hypothetical protein
MNSGVRVLSRYGRHNDADFLSLSNITWGPRIFRIRLGIRSEHDTDFPAE